jgi:hypothetical protein
VSPSAWNLKTEDAFTKNYTLITTTNSLTLEAI